MPAFWWLYNMYALARNASKFKSRDRRVTKVQNIEFDTLAPDTVEEILRARALLETWVGADDLEGDTGRTDEPIVVDVGMERSKRPTVILKPRQGYHAYGDMVVYYAVRNLVAYLIDRPDATPASMNRELAGDRQRDWVNLGGQLMPARDVDQLRADIASGSLGTWDDVHRRYDELWQDYPLARQRHALGSLCDLLGIDELDADTWRSSLARAIAIQEYVCEQVYLTRNKDFDNPFSQALFRGPDEMKAAVGKVEDDAFVRQVREDTLAFKRAAGEILNRGWSHPRS
jgi:hypothetical protein